MGDILPGAGAEVKASVGVGKMNKSQTAKAFGTFCQRFIRNYFEDDGSDLPGYEPSEMTFEEFLSETEYNSLFEKDGPGLFTLRMANKAGDVWRFTFRLVKGQWTIHSATSGDSSNEARVDWLDAVYSKWFVPLLNRITRKSQ